MVPCAVIARKTRKWSKSMSGSSAAAVTNSNPLSLYISKLSNLNPNRFELVLAQLSLQLLCCVEGRQKRGAQSRDYIKTAALAKGGLAYDVQRNGGGGGKREKQNG